MTTNDESPPKPPDASPTPPVKPLVQPPQDTSWIEMELIEESPPEDYQTSSDD